MRHHAILAATALLATGILAPAVGLAQSPSTDQIIKSLTPTSPTGATRGLRIAPATAAPSQSQSQPQPQWTAPVHAAAAAAPVSAPAISLTVQFANGSAQLTPQAIQTLDSLGRALSNQALTAYRFRIEGHTDTVGTREYNRELSDRRAAAVVDYIATNFHVDRDRIEAIGMGEDGLLIPTPDQTPEPRNRRVQVVNIGS
jgi:outer membrane protein OmpA-like peptidoglycan-associated protein